MSPTTYTPEVLLSLFARGFHFCFFFFTFAYFALVKREKANFSYLFALCSFMVTLSTGVGTITRFFHVEGLSLEVDSICDLAIVPTFAVFGYSLVKQNTKLWKLLLCWLIGELPVLTSLICYISTSDKLFVLGGLTYVLIVIVLTLIWGFIQINRYNKLLHESYSDTDNRSLTWFKVILTAMIGFVIAYFVIGKYFHMEYMPAVQSVYFIGTEILILIIAFYVNKQENVDEEIMDDVDDSDDVSGSSNEYKDFVRELKEKLKINFEEKKLYTKANLTIKDLADVLDSNPKYVSNYLNNTLGKNFNQYINGLRVREACEIMKVDRAITFDELAIAVGFNSKATFWRIFQVEYEQSPADFRSNLGNDDIDTLALRGDSGEQSQENHADGSKADISVNLSLREKKLCHLILEGADTQQQCKGLDIRENSLRVMRSRLRKHLQLSSKDNLLDFLILHRDLL